MKLTKKQAILPAIIAGALFFAPSAKASPKAGTLAKSCSAQDGVEAAVCIGYISGWTDALGGLRIATSGGKVSQVVFAEGVTVEQISRVYVKYMLAHPEFENKTADFELGEALIEAKLMGLIPVAPEAKSN